MATELAHGKYSVKFRLQSFDGHVTQPSLDLR
jgi:methionine-rich copper-binding protein CopC